MARSGATAVSAVLLSLALTGVGASVFVGQSATASATAYDPVEPCEAGQDVPAGDHGHGHHHLADSEQRAGSAGDDDHQDRHVDAEDQVDPHSQGDEDHEGAGTDAGRSEQRAAAPATADAERGGAERLADH